jgi:hypothetical protein
MKKIVSLFICLACVCMMSVSQTQMEMKGAIKLSHSNISENGYLRWNASIRDFEGYTNHKWISLTKTSVWGVHKPYLANENQKITASDGSDVDRFGYSVAIAGEVAIIGASLDDLSGHGEGSAYIFKLTGDAWIQLAKLIASDAADDDHFGTSVAISDNTALVGASGNGDAGSAYIFVRPPGGWIDMTESAKLTSSDGANNDFFGNSVAISRDVVIVGADGDNLTGIDEGSAYIFVRPFGGWTTMTETAKLTAFERANDDQFGNSVAISGDVAIVGAFQDDQSGMNEGSAYIFVKPDSGWITMTETGKLIASDAADDDQFGGRVSIHDDVAVVGAIFDDLSGTNEGSAYIFEKPSGGWTNMTETAKLTASDASDEDKFGVVAISGDAVIVGAAFYDFGGDEGKAYIFEKPSRGWTNMTESAGLLASDRRKGDWFGASVSISGEVAIIGAFRDDLLGVEEGSAYIFWR